MSCWRKIDTEEFDREFAEIRERVFGQEFWNGFWKDSWNVNEDHLFADPDWRIALLPETPFYHTGPGPEYGRNKTGPEPPHGYPPIKPYFRSYFEPFCMALESIGIDEIVATTRWTGGIKGSDGRYHGTKHADYREEKEAHCVLRPTLATFKDAYIGDEGLLNYGIFSREGNWGMLCTNDEKECSVLGGTTEFMETFYRAAGGEKNVRALLGYFLLVEGGGWLSDACSEGDERVLRELHQQAGWPFPNRWWTYLGEEVDWSWMMDDEGFPEK